MRSSPSLASFAAALAYSPLLSLAADAQAYSWKNVKIGGGGGFVPGIVFNPSEKGLAYARTDIGGAYKLNSDDTWTPLLDFANSETWNYWGVDALATDPVEPNRLYLATGEYTNDWDPNNGHILISEDYGETFTAVELDFKVGGNMPGRGMGERLVVDPNDNSVLYFGARSGNGLLKSTDYGATWEAVSGLPSAGTYVADPSDATGYNSDIIGVSWVTFDSTSGSSGSPTPRIFVGVASAGEDNIFVSEDAGATWDAVAGQNNTFIPHKGVLSPSEGLLYISYSNGAGPYDGTLGSVWKYDIASSNWTEITPASGDDLFFGFGGVAVDLQNPGTILVAALNAWWPDGQIYRSTDSGATWSPLWDWGAYPEIHKYYSYHNDLAPWLGPNYVVTELGTLQIGWMMEALVIDPFDSDHWLYGTGATIYGGHDLTAWDSKHNVSISSLADGIEEDAILGLISPPTGPSLLSAVGDNTGFVHEDLDTAPSTRFQNPEWSTSVDIDYAGNVPTTIVRVGNAGDDPQQLIALSTDSGANWNPSYASSTDVQGGKVAISANATSIVWSSSSNGVLVSKNSASFTAVSSVPSGAVIASDKVNDSAFYAASGSSFYASTDGGASFNETATLGDSTAPFDIAVNFNTVGDVWVSTDKGLFHSNDNGATFTAIDGISQAWALGLGAAKEEGAYPAVFVAATLGGVSGYYRSDDEGATWVQIDDAKHGFGAPGSNVLTGDPRIYGRVYIGTNGRGIFYGDIA
ncbi:glycoside hydrolase family 74 protein [Schizophyllum commune H4-8]|uniref:glycoside hydrolase family 74 protein n=1 Tax=Schizophyllum commune (strain H4-8 / FGSC 9210) TaxID=578458 RepID=UPI00215F7F20|nr:glycoside hydrolase family 74 protein [Schizophyllum commune H4-8]KAI5897742.1 glycoside hydrolase family 74 protein [Schizophyllum commune H4-8]